MDDHIVARTHRVIIRAVSYVDDRDTAQTVKTDHIIAVAVGIIDRAVIADAGEADGIIAQAADEHRITRVIGFDGVIARSRVGGDVAAGIDVNGIVSAVGENRRPMVDVGIPEIIIAFGAVDMIGKPLDIELHVIHMYRLPSSIRFNVDGRNKAADRLIGSYQSAAG